MLYGIELGSIVFNVNGETDKSGKCKDKHKHTVCWLGQIRQSNNRTGCVGWELMV